MPLSLVAEWDFEGRNYVHLRIVEATGGKMRGWLYRSSGATVQVFGSVDEPSRKIEFAEASSSKSIVNVVHYIGSLKVAISDPTRVLRIEGEWSLLKLRFSADLKFKGFERVTGKFKAKNPQPIIS